MAMTARQHQHDMRLKRIRSSSVTEHKLSPTHSTQASAFVSPASVAAPVNAPIAVSSVPPPHTLGPNKAVLPDLALRSSPTKLPKPLRRAFTETGITTKPRFPLLAVSTEYKAPSKYSSRPAAPSPPLIDSLSRMRMMGSSTPRGLSKGREQPSPRSAVKSPIIVKSGVAPVRRRQSMSSHADAAAAGGASPNDEDLTRPNINGTNMPLTARESPPRAADARNIMRQPLTQRSPLRASSSEAALRRGTSASPPSAFHTIAPLSEPMSAKDFERSGAVPVPPHTLSPLPALPAVYSLTPRTLQKVIEEHEALAVPEPASANSYSDASSGSLSECMRGDDYYVDPISVMNEDDWSSLLGSFQSTPSDDTTSGTTRSTTPSFLRAKLPHIYEEQAPLPPAAVAGHTHSHNPASPTGSMTSAQHSPGSTGSPTAFDPAFLTPQASPSRPPLHEAQTQSELLPTDAFSPSSRSSNNNTPLPLRRLGDHSGSAAAGDRENLHDNSIPPNLDTVLDAATLMATGTPPQSSLQRELQRLHVLLREVSETGRRKEEALKEENLSLLAQLRRAQSSGMIESSS